MQWIENVFDPAVSEGLIAKIEGLSPVAVPLWGRMNVAQMLAHCNVTYELVFENNHKRPNALKRLLLVGFVKKAVVSEKPYKKNGPTAPEFKVADSRDFALEQERLIAYIRRTQVLGKAHFDGLESHSFGVLTAVEWNNMFYKHLEHHLAQFGAIKRTL
ncbi:DUF1569 domain-containing protein [Flavobacterium sp. JP2137]|uniref:DUF1569 domain-containing protein n=1 Tax=Flavobacterium sp. JP2137 TaxID=3414510 RepID=UPI003D2F9F22